MSPDFAANQLPKGASDARKSVTQDSLDAIGWGLAYPDLWRLIGLPFLAPKLCDRGKAVETDWQGGMG